MGQQELISPHPQKKFKSQQKPTSRNKEIGGEIK
jgi:hypothetical protein